MQFQTPTMSNLMRAAVIAVKARSQLLILLTALAGILSSIVYAPAAEVLNELLLASEEASETGQGQTAVAEIFQNGATTLLLGHLAVTAISAFLLVPWARASAPGGLIPSDGGAGAFWVRGLRSFLHLVAASGLTMLIILFAFPIVTVIAGALGGLGSAVMLAAVFFIIWAAIALTATAHLAIAAEARDRRETIWSAFVRARLFMAPIAGSLALLLFLMMIANLITGGIITGILPTSVQMTVSSIMSGALLYLVSALHVAALYIVPDFRDLRA